MNTVDTFNQWSVVWARYMGSHVGETTIAFVVIATLWALFHKRLSPQVGYWLFLLVLLKGLISVPVSIPPSLHLFSPQQVLVYAEKWTLAFRSDSIGVTGDENPVIEQTGDSTSSLAPNSESIPTLAGTDEINEANPTVLPSGPYHPSLSPMTPIMLFWAVIVLFLLGRLVWLQWRYTRYVKSLKTIDCRTLPVDWAELKSRLQLRRPVRLVISPTIAIPVISGLVRPHLILPPDFFQSFSPHQARWILLHELAHVKRWDTSVALLQKIVQSVFFFNPVIWLANWMIDQQREYACDDIALATCGSPRSDCGQGFLSLALRHSRRPAFAVGALGLFNHNTLVRRRMMRILDGERKLTVKVSLGAAAVLLLIAVLVLPSVRAGETQTDLENPAGIVADATATNAEDAKPETEKKPISIRQLSQKEGLDYYSSYTLSKDGRYLASLDVDTGNLLVKDQKTGEIRDLTQKGTWEESSDMIWEFVFSPDSQSLAYIWYIGKTSKCEIRLVNLDGSERRVVYSEAWPSDLRWASNGKLYFIGGDQLIELSPLKQDLRVLFTFPGTATRSVMSHDAQYVAWTQPSGSDSKNDIYLYSIPENRQVCLVQHPADDKILGWSPNSKWIVFKSDLLGDWSLWGMPVTLDTVVTAVLLKRGIENSDSFKVTPDGNYYAHVTKSRLENIIAEIDFESGEFISPPQSISSPLATSGRNGGYWSQDGKFIAFQGELYPSRQLCVYSAENKVFRDYPAKLYDFVAGEWVDNDRFLVGFGTKSMGRNSGIYQINVQTEELQELIPPRDDANLRYVGFLHYPDRLVYSSQIKGSDKIQFLLRDLTTGKDEEIYSGIAGDVYSSLASNMGELYHGVADGRYNILSSDGKWICSWSREGEEQILKKISLDSHESHDLYRTSGVQFSARMPDQQNILFLKRENGGAETSLWKLHLESGTAKKVHQFATNVNYFQVHPDGKHVVYTETTTKLITWVTENFLPEEAMN